MGQQSIQMRFNTETVNKVEQLSTILNMHNKAQIVAQAISVYEDLIRIHLSGGKIISKYDNGQEKVLEMKGLDKFCHYHVE